MNYKSLFRLALPIFLLFIFIYALSANPYSNGYADSDELITAGFIGGVAHPPGYSLVVLSIGLAQRLLPFLPPAHAANLTASLWQAAAVALMAASAGLFFRILGLPLKKWTYIIIFTGVSLVGLSSQIWLYGAIVEVHSFNNFLMVATVTAALGWWHSKKTQENSTGLFLVTCFLAGLGISQVQTFILIFPGLALILFWGLKSGPVPPAYRRISLWLLGLSAFLVAFILAAAALWLLNLSRAEFSWAFAPELRGLIHFLQRKDYAGYFVEEGLKRSAYLVGLSPRFFTAQPLYFVRLFEQIGLVASVTALLGLFFLIKKRFKPSLPLILMFMLTGPLLAGYMQLGPRDNSQDLEYYLNLAIAERQLLMSHLLVGIFVISGLYACGEFVTQKLGPKTSSYFLGAFGLLAILASFLSYRSVGIKRDNLVETYGRQMLVDAEPNSAIICSSDIACFSLIYLSLVEKVRPDVVILTDNYKYRSYFLTKNPQFYSHFYTDNPFYNANLVAWNVAHRPTYLTNPDSYYINYLGLDGNPFYLVPEGYLFRILTTKPDTFKKPAYSATHLLLNQKPSKLDYWQRGMYDYFTSLHSFTGRIYTHWGQKTAAKAAFEYALSLKPDFEEPLVWVSELESIPPEQETYRNHPLVSYEEYIAEAKAQLAAGKLEDAYQTILKASYMSPLSLEPHQLLLEIYQKNNYPEHQLMEQKFIDRLTSSGPR